MRRRLVIAMTLFVAANRLTASPPATWTSPFAELAWSLTDIAGSTHSPWADPQTKAVVLVFIGTNCPVSNYYQPTLRGLQQQFTAPQVGWYLVHTDPGTTIERAQQHARDFSISAPVLLDPEHVLARAANATKLPQAAVLTRDGAIAYLGRIDDTFVGFGKKRAAPSQLDLKAAVHAVSTGQPVAVPRTESVGCFIPFASP